jgi:hypothetical protein
LNTKRRIFLLHIIAGAGAVAAVDGAQAQQKLDPKDPQAAALGYVDDTAKADKKRFPRHTNDQQCKGCQFYSGLTGSKEGPCAVFGGKLVAASGWCSSWIKKA